MPWPGSWYLLLSRGSSSLQHFPLRAACWHRHCLRSNITCRDSAWVQFYEKLPPNLCSEPYKSEVFLGWFFVVVGFLFCFFLRASVYSTIGPHFGKEGRGNRQMGAHIPLSPSPGVVLSPGTPHNLVASSVSQTLHVAVPQSCILSYTSQTRGRQSCCLPSLWPSSLFTYC